MTEAMTQTATNPTAAGDATANSATAQQTTLVSAPAAQQATSGDKPATPPAAETKAVDTPYTFKAPEGTNLDSNVMQKYGDTAKQLGLSQDNAQRLIDQIAPAMQERSNALKAQERSSWEEASRGDKEFGGDKLNDSLAIARKALTQFGSPELSKLLNETGLGNHPEVIRAWYRAGQAISEDRYVGGNQSGAKPSTARDFNSLASALYPNG